MEEAEKEPKKDASAEEFVALSDFTASGSDQLSFLCGDRLLVHARPCEDWWWAELREDMVGYVPASHLLQCRISTRTDSPTLDTGPVPREKEEGLEDKAEPGEQEEDLEDPWQDVEYFGSYGTLKLHLEMLSDRSRTEAYRQVVLNNRDFLRDKVVMDLGCGTGIISLFCAQLAQTAKVYAVEASPIVEYTRRLVRQNDCEDVVCVLQGRAEQVQLPQRVDVLLSEWMGNCLLFEFMVEAVLLARQRWLAEGGVMWPSSAALLLVPCQAHSFYTETMTFWERPYGLDFSPLQPLAQQEFFTKPKFSHVLEPQDCLSTPSEVLFLNMYTLTVQDLEEMEGQFDFLVDTPGDFHGFCAWFTVGFESLQPGGEAVQLDTGPFSEPTHWKQTLFMLDSPVSVHQGESIRGSIVLRRNPTWRRHLSITFDWVHYSPSENQYKIGSKTFPMWR
ncbi:protein arginine N-methyltransferase 2 [Periophthalmus magnuspinnatus]|uniref:protein arginine N-methyltransferase 2 n=1 Tax=Periophthalmus magnuspinnatus TaxID=409849 RepID=UPI00145A8D43|nr:protein arginine N-methyltransferase 2 [Periophthalmus magnuspinnatus]XP_055086775.1 protein arginine N-methyltransferase 2 [Periophthalmus magnuspinnatus]